MRLVELAYQEVEVMGLVVQEDHQATLIMVVRVLAEAETVVMAGRPEEMGRQTVPPAGAVAEDAGLWYPILNTEHSYQ